MKKIYFTLIFTGMFLVAACSPQHGYDCRDCDPHDNRAAAIEAAAERVDGVKKAGAVVAGNNAIVGLSLNEELDGEALVSLKKRVDAAIKQTDAAIDHTAISCSPDLYKKLIPA